MEPPVVSVMFIAHMPVGDLQGKEMTLIQLVLAVEWPVPPVPKALSR